MANFLRYVDAGFYNDLVWHRVDGDFVIQTGAYQRGADRLVRPRRRPSANLQRSRQRAEQHRQRRGDQPADDDADSAQSEFYINVVDNTDLDSGNPAYTVFGRVVDGEEFVEAIAAVAVGDDPSGLEETPLDDIIMQSIRRAVTEVPTDSDSNGPVIDIEATTQPDDDLRIVGETTRLRTTVVDAPDGLRYAWEVLSGAASFANPTTASPVVTIESADTGTRLTVRGDGVRTATADAYVVGVENATPRVIIENAGGVEGEIVLELLTEAAPSTCAKLLRYAMIALRRHRLAPRAAGLRGSDRSIRAQRRHVGAAGRRTSARDQRSE